MSLPGSGLCLLPYLRKVHVWGVAAHVFRPSRSLCAGGRWQAGRRVMARFGGGEGQPRRDGPGRDAVTLGLPRRRLLIAGAGLLSTAGLGAVGCEASRPDPAQPRTTAMAEAPARRT